MIQDGRVYRAVWFEEDGDRRLAKCLVSEGSPPLPGSFAAPEQERTEIEFVDWFSADMIDAAVAREEALSGSVLVYRTGDQHLNVKRPLLESK